MIRSEDSRERRRESGYVKQEKETALTRAVEDYAMAEAQADARIRKCQEALDIQYQEKKLERYRKLLEADGWVYAESAGRVTDCRIAVGERTPGCPPASCIQRTTGNGLWRLFFYQGAERTSLRGDFVYNGD